MSERRRHTDVEKAYSGKSLTLGMSIEEATEEMRQRIPLKRIGTAKDIADAAVFLCSEESNFITGQTINVDGGFEMN